MNDTSPKTPRIFSSQEIFRFKQHYINTWKPESEVWALKHGDTILGSLTAVGSIFITYMFRKELKLRAYARMTCYFPVVGISSLVCFIAQDSAISSDIIRATSCPLCTVTKSNFIQLGLSVGYPIMCAGTVCFYMADRLLTYPVPPLVKAPKECFQLFQKIVHKHARSFLVISAMHMFTASFITLKKQRNFGNLGLKK